MKIKNYSGRNFKKRRARDKISKEKRSAVMSRVRSKNTGLEKEFIKLLRQEIPTKFSVFRSDIFGKPDVVFSDNFFCVFIDSDFWHGWQYPRWKHLLKNDFWRQKIERNRKRDRKVTSYLRKNGWVVVRIWEHMIKNDLRSVVSNIKSRL